MVKIMRHPPKGQAAGSVYSAASYAGSEVSVMTEKDREVADESKLKRLKALKKMYFGNRKSGKKAGEKEKEKESAPREATSKLREKENPAPVLEVRAEKRLSKAAEATENPSTAV